MIMRTLEQIELEGAKLDEGEESEESEIARVTNNILRSKRLRTIRAELGLPDVPEPCITQRPVDVNGFVASPRDAADSYREAAIEYFQ